MRRLLIVKTGSTFPRLAAALGDFDAWVAAGLGDAGGTAVTVAVDRGEPLPAHGKAAGVIVTGSPAMVTEQTPWMRTTAAWLQAAVQAGVPVFGICFGHQLLAAAMGGTVDWNPRGREIGTVEVTLTPAGQSDPLLGTLPAAFPAQVTHRQSVITLPAGARLLAGSALDRHQAFAIGTRAWGVQFHPEFSPAAMHGYLVHLAGELQGEGLDVEGLRRGARATPEAAGLLESFARLCRQL